MYQPAANMKSKKSEQPANNQNDSDYIQKTSHGINVLIFIKNYQFYYIIILPTFGKIRMYLAQE